MTSRLKALRQELKVSTSELSMRLGVSQSSIIRFEQSEASGTISLNTLKKISNALGVEFSYVFGPPTSKANEKRFHGRKRSRKHSKNRSDLSERMRQDLRDRARELSPQERIFQACALSDFAKSLR